MDSIQQNPELAATLPRPDGRFVLWPAVMTEEELIRGCPTGS